jgi:rhodanese-related sulfurtransferase
MHEIVRFLEQHGYWLLVGTVLAGQACLPIPANLFLVPAEALARSGSLNVQYSDINISPSREVVLNCASPGEFTSARVALALREKGVNLVRPLAGGFQAWRDRGFPITPNVRVPSNSAT